MGRETAFAVTTGLAAMLVAMPALADTLVLRSSGPSAGSFPPGQTLGEEQEISLKAGDALTVLDSVGTRTVRGPMQRVRIGGVRVEGGEGARLSSLLGANRRARVGAVRTRNNPSAYRPPNLWHLDFAKGGTFCVTDVASLRLWRQPEGDKATLLVTGEGQSASPFFDEGMTVVAWPADLPVKDGARYTLSGGDLASPVTIRFALLPQPADKEALARGLIEKQCNAQLDLFIDAFAVPEPAQK